MEPTCALTTATCLNFKRDDLLLLLCPLPEKKKVEGTVSELFRLGRDTGGGRVLVRETRECCGGEVTVGDFLHEVVEEGDKVILCCKLQPKQK